MPIRITPLINEQYYHIFNRGINKQPIFLDRRDYRRALEIFEFYHFAKTPVRYSKFLQNSPVERGKILEELRKNSSRRVEPISFCLMPNHFHFLIKQNVENGISRFMADFQNSYTRYFNVKHEKIGPLLQGQFKAVRVEDENQLLHLSRYIHLNPHTSYLMRTVEELVNYQWSSFPGFLNLSQNNICSTTEILTYFKKSDDYRNFVFDQADYQRTLKMIEHLTFEG